jgi:hypothetical protein
VIPINKRLSVIIIQDSMRHEKVRVSEKDFPFPWEPSSLTSCCKKVVSQKYLHGNDKNILIVLEKALFIKSVNESNIFRPKPIPL